MASAGLEPHPPRPAPGPEAWFTQGEAAVVAALETDGAQGLPQAEAAARLARDGANEITGEEPPSVWQVAIEQLRGSRQELKARASVDALSKMQVPHTPILKALAISLVPVLMVVLATELPRLQRGLLTESLSGRQWFACPGLATLLPLVIEGRKWLLRRRAPKVEVLDVQRAVATSRAGAP